MLSHIATDLHEVYLEEVFKPQLGKPGASTPPKPATKSSSDIDGDGDVDSFEKKVRQLIYDIRHIMRRDKITADQAFNVKVSTVKKYGSDVIKAAKEKLGIKTGGAVSVSEESSERMVKVTINYKNGTIDRRNVPYGEISTLRAKPTISSVEVSSNKVSNVGGGGGAVIVIGWVIGNSIPGGMFIVSVKTGDGTLTKSPGFNSMIVPGSTGGK